MSPKNESADYSDCKSLGEKEKKKEEKMRKYVPIIGYRSLVIVFLLVVGCTSQYMTAGKVYIQQEEYEKAIEQFNLQLEQNPQDVDALWWMGMTYAYQKKYEEACKYIDKAKEVAPDKKELEKERGFLWSLYYNAGIYANRDEDFEIAKKRFTQASEFGPDSVQTYMNLAIVWSNLGENDSSVVYYKRAIKVAPENTEAYRNLGIHYKNIKEYNPAIGYFRKALDIEPEDANLSYLLGVCYYLQENYGDAERAFRHSIECDNTLEDAYFNLGASLIKEEKYEEGIEVFKKAVELKPDDVEALSHLASVYLLTENYDLAVETYTKIIELDELNCDAYEGRANAYWKLGKKKEANDDLKKIKELK